MEERAQKRQERKKALDEKKRKAEEERLVREHFNNLWIVRISAFNRKIQEWRAFNFYNITTEILKHSSRENEGDDHEL